jgi:hypothetical protein
MEPLHTERCSILRIFQSPQQRSPPSRFSSQSSHRKRHSISRAFFYLSLKVPDEEVPPPISPTGPLWRERLVTRAFFYIPVYFIVPGKGAPPPHSPVEPLWRVMPLSRAFFYISLYPKSLSSHSVPEPSVSQTSLWTSVGAFGQLL